MDGNIPDAGDMLERLRHMPAFVFQLLGVAQELPGASAAETAVTAGGRHPVRGRLDDLHQAGFGKVLFLPGDLYQRPIAWRRLVHEDRHPVDPGDASAAESEAGDFGFKYRLFSFAHFSYRLEKPGDNFKRIKGFMEIELDFMADGFRLRGTLHLPQAPSPPLVIGCHGLLSDRMSPKQIALAEACNRLGMAFFRFDHRGCGESEGRLEMHTSLDNRCSDLLHAIRHLANRADLGKRVGLFGSSMGGAVCLRAAGQADIVATVTFAAPIKSRALKITRGQQEADPEQTRMSAILQEDFDLGPRLSMLRNILIFHGEADDVVPVAHAHEIFQQAAHPKRLVLQPGGDHLMSDPRHQAEFIRAASFWLNKGLS